MKMFIYPYEVLDSWEKTILANRVKLGIYKHKQFLTPDFITDVIKDYVH